MKKGKIRVLAGMMGAVLIWTEILSVGIRVSAAGEGTVVMTEVAVQDEESTEDTMDYAVEETEDWKSESSTEKEEAQEGVSDEEESVGGEVVGDSAEQEGEKQDEEEMGKAEGDICQDGSETGNESAARRLESMASADDIAGGIDKDIAWVIDVNGKLIVEGTGDFPTGGDQYQRAPWYPYRTSIISAQINVSGMTVASYMFYDCSSLSSLDLSSFNTGNVTDMSGMFYGCSSLSSLDLSSFNTENVGNMGLMFYDCSSLSSLDLSSFNTKNVGNMGLMFYGCSSLSSLDLSSFNTGNVGNMGLMFYGCSSLSSLDLSSFNTGNVGNMGLMFYGCSSLSSLDLSSFNTENVTNMGGMFEDCNNLSSLDLSNFNTGNVTCTESMFGKCSSLIELDLSSFNLSNIESSYYVSEFLTNCSSLATIYAPYNLSEYVELPIEDNDTWYRSDGTTVTELPQNLSYSIVLGKNYIPQEKITESTVIELKDGQSTVFTYDTATNQPIADAAVTIDGNTYPTNSKGIAIFTAPAASEKSRF